MSKQCLELVWNWMILGELQIGELVICVAIGLSIRAIQILYYGRRKIRC